MRDADVFYLLRNDEIYPKYKTYDAFDPVPYSQSLLYLIVIKVKF